MGLKDDIYKALEKNIGKEHIKNSSDGQSKVDTLATDLRDAIINFITKQDFNITEMEAPINFLAGEISTIVTGPVAPPNATLLPGASGKNLAPIASIAQISETSNKISDGRVPGAVRTSKVKLLQVKEA